MNIVLRIGWVKLFEFKISASFIYTSLLFFKEFFFNSKQVNSFFVLLKKWCNSPSECKADKKRINWRESILDAHMNLKQMHEFKLHQWNEIFWNPSALMKQYLEYWMVNKNFVFFYVNDAKIVGDIIWIDKEASIYFDIFKKFLLFASGSCEKKLFCI